MARKDWSTALDQVTFKCGLCTSTFRAKPDLVEDEPATEYHPYRYYAHCPHCASENQPQVGWERALMAAHQAATGPKTQEGKAASASNLAGHPTPAEAHVTRFNALKHGLHARVATFFPAKPEKYAFCSSCEVDRGWCAAQPACVKQTELFMLHHAAVEQRNPKHLGKIHADILAALTASLQLCLQAVLGDGVVIKTPKVELSRNGNPVAMTWTDEAGDTHQIYDYHANPAFKPIADLVTRLGLSMTDLGLTQKALDDDEGKGMGTLSLDAGTKESLAAFQARMEQLTDKMAEKLGRASARRRADPVLIDHQAQGKDS